jgi:hypothetical protein
MHRYIVLHTYVLCIYRYLNASPRGITSIVCPWSKDQASQLLGAESAHRFHWSLEKTSMKSKNPMGELERVNRCFFFHSLPFSVWFSFKKTAGFSQGTGLALEDLAIFGWFFGISSNPMYYNQCNLPPLFPSSTINHYLLLLIIINWGSSTMDIINHYQSLTIIIVQLLTMDNNLL